MESYRHRYSSLSPDLAEPASLREFFLKSTGHLASESEANQHSVILSSSNSLLRFEEHHRVRDLCAKFWSLEKCLLSVHLSIELHHQSLFRFYTSEQYRCGDIQCLKHR